MSVRGRGPVSARLLVAAFVLASVFGGGCGSGSTAGTTGADRANGAADAPSRPAAAGGDNSIQEFGAEGSEAERAAAAAALHGFLDARAAGRWRVACSHMAPAVAASLVQLAAGSEGRGGEESCPGVLASLSAGVARAALREAALADVEALRVEGDSGFLLFHGADGEGLFIPMARLGGAWKVAAIAPSALP